MATAFIMMLFIWVVTAGISLLSYVLQAWGMYTIAKRRGIPNPWTAWVPVAKDWLLGGISDQYQYVTKGRVTSRRKIMLTISVLALVLSLLAGLFGGMTTIVNLVQSAFGENEVVWNEAMGTYEVLGTQSNIASSGLALVGMGVLSGILSLVLTVYSYIALYDLYASCTPDMAIVFLLLSIFINIAQPILIFISRHKDNGMART